MIVPRHRIDELRALHDRMLALPMTLPDGVVALADLVARALALIRPMTVAELEPAHALAISARADLQRAMTALKAAMAALVPAGAGDAHDAAVHALHRLTVTVDKVATGDLTLPFRWDLDLIAEAVDQLNPQLDQGRQALVSVLVGIEQTDRLDYIEPEQFGRARAAAVVGALDCVEAYERFDRLAVGAVRVVDERAAFAVFRGGHDPLDPLAVLVR